jgi:fumarate reductase flavoprotein subunit
MEMVQFHPTGLLGGEGTRMTGTVLEEGLRGAGGHLLNGEQHRFMADYDPKAERATRDVVSRAIYQEMREGRTTPNGGVYISMSHLGSEQVTKKFKGMVRRCADCGFDLAGGLVEVVPTAHYLMGGVVVDEDTRTEMPGLYVAGEDAGGAHGANRLGGNGVANSTVYGGIAGSTMGGDAPRALTWRDPDEAVLRDEVDRACEPFKKKPAAVHPLRNRLMDVMWDHVGVMRDEAGIRRGLEEVRAISDELTTIGVDGSNLAFNLTWHDWLNLQSLVEMSEVIGKAALARENSRGAHYREDFPEVGDLDSSYFTVACQDGDDLRVERKAVEFTHVKPGETLLRDGEARSLVEAAE